MEILFAIQSNLCLFFSLWNDSLNELIQLNESDFSAQCHSTPGKQVLVSVFSEFPPELVPTVVRLSWFQHVCLSVSLSRWCDVVCEDESQRESRTANYSQRWTNPPRGGTPHWRDGEGLVLVSPGGQTLLSWYVSDRSGFSGSVRLSSFPFFDPDGFSLALE